MKNVMFLLSAVSLFGCATHPSTDYHWHKSREPSTKVLWVVSSQDTINAHCSSIARYNPMACTINQGGACTIFAKDSILDVHPEVARHEMAHCLGYSHD